MLGMGEVLSHGLLKVSQAAPGSCPVQNRKLSLLARHVHRVCMQVQLYTECNCGIPCARSLMFRYYWWKTKNKWNHAACIRGEAYMECLSSVAKLAKNISNFGVATNGRSRIVHKARGVDLLFKRSRAGLTGPILYPALRRSVKKVRLSVYSNGSLSVQ